MTTSLTTPGKYVVVRSQVPSRASYGEYLPELRIDFWFSCAYCTLCESEANGIKLEIDHYEPQKSSPSLANTYSNLMYSCEICNQFKWKRSPPPSARAAGLRFFKADIDDAADHFELNGLEVEGKSLIGNFTIDALNLNREMLQRLRDLRKSIHDSLEHLAFGVRALRSLKVDRLPQALKTRYRFAAVEAESDQARVDRVLREASRSELLDASLEAEDAERAKKRRQHLHDWRAQYPGPWWEGDDKPR